MKHFFPRLLNKLGLLKHLNINVNIKLEKHPVSIPIIKTIGLRNLIMTEIWMVEVLKRITPIKKGLFIDVGINIGQTLIKLKSVNKDIKYFGFEPNPLCVFYANELIKQNDFKNTTVIPAGIYSSNKILSLNLYSQNELDSAASVIAEFRPQPIIKKMYVPVLDIKTLENHQQEFSEIGIIKIDVEGGELEVLSSMEEMIQSNRPFILIEILPTYEESNSFRIDRQNKIESLLKEWNYSIYRILKNDDDSFNSFIKLETIEVHKSIELCDYILTPKESESNLG